MARRKQVKARFWLILMAALLSLFFALYTSQENLIQQRSRYIQELLQQKTQLEIEIDSAERRLDFAKSDDYVERIARSQLGLIMPDEVLYVNSANR